jgi:Calcineurin-like phosphoesterase
MTLCVFLALCGMSLLVTQAAPGSAHPHHTFLSTSLSSWFDARDQFDFDRVNFHVNHQAKTTSFLAGQPGARGTILYTFPTETTVAEFVQSPAIVTLHGGKPAECVVHVTRSSNDTNVLPTHEEHMVGFERLFDTFKLGALPQEMAGIRMYSLFHLVCVVEDTHRPIVHQLYAREFTEHRKPDFSLDAVRDSELLEGARLAYTHMMNTEREYPLTSSDLYSLKISTALSWIYQLATHHFSGPPMPFQTYNNTGESGIYHMNSATALKYTGESRKRSDLHDDGEIRIGISADWASGTRESDYVAQLMMKGFDPHHTIHVGDIYYIGSEAEAKSNCLGVAPDHVQKGVKWPSGSIGSWALAGNHEMYGLDKGYFNTFLPNVGLANSTKGQLASYFVLENSYWRVINLDTGYHTYALFIDSKNNTQPQAVIDWLVDTVKLNDPTDTRGIIFISHHQYRSAFDTPYLATPKQLAKLVPAGRQVLWLWGHEHRLALYNMSSFGGVDLNAYGRCLGVGGFPVSMGGIPGDARASGLVAYDDRQYSVLDGIINNNIGFNGFTRMYLNQTEARLEYYSLVLDQNGVLSNTTSTLLITETFQANLDSGNVELLSQTIVDKNVTVVDHV